jgi:nucleoid-associated protein YgaU
MPIISKIVSAFWTGQPKYGVLVVGLLLILAGYFAYSNFTKSNTEVDNEPVTIQTTKESLGSISGGAIGPRGVYNSDGTVAGASTQSSSKMEASSKRVSPNWTARQISKNSIKDATYKVQKGDTLWQIAQGKYGSGFEWTKILQANEDKVGFLPDGSHALIEIGQELVLP